MSSFGFLAVVLGLMPVLLYRVWLAWRLFEQRLVNPAVAACVQIRGKRRAGFLKGPRYHWNAISEEIAGAFFVNNDNDNFVA